MGRFLQASGYIFINWSIHSLVLYLCLCKDTYVIRTIDSFTLNSQSQVHPLLPHASLSNTFSPFPNLLRYNGLQHYTCGPL
jgi:hypothetical protein